MQDNVNLIYKLERKHVHIRIFIGILKTTLWLSYRSSNKNANRESSFAAPRNNNLIRGGGGSPTEVRPVSPRIIANSDNRLPKDSLLRLRITFFKSVIPPCSLAGL